MSRVSTLARPLEPASFGFIAPQLPTLVAEPPAGEDWIHEIKHDGYRTQVIITPDDVRAFTRNGHDWTDRYPRIVDAAAALDCGSAVIDGEAIVQNERGASDFKALRTALHGRSSRIVMFAFDLLRLDGEDLRSRPLVERRALLKALLAGREMTFGMHFSEAYDGSGAELFSAVDRLGLEGVVSKRADSRYRSGRSDAWLKAKCYGEATFQVIGVEKTSSGGLTALLADEDDGALHFAGRAVVNLDGPEADRFKDRLARLAVSRPVPGLKPSSKAQWVKPGLAVRVRFLKGEETLRHASLLGLAPGA
ncbi:non-homologous end-joining DNA ligase [Chthonobacter rhizosphaerae]|uniref:non-homologous end-joining DNA ligase n=1 Tax=Chthonobacter rhizosphaerae TaxID=2735553 RepID=UPI0015EF3EFD|nr:non-homologous end-joining DNA ligase [Chthonobacter rhizosphaerae]